MNDRAIVVLPTYNEAENLPRMVSRIQAALPEIAILVVDENEHAPVPRVLDDLFGRRDGGGQVEDVGSEVGHNGSAGLSAAALDKAASLGQSGRAVLD